MSISIVRFVPVALLPSLASIAPIASAQTQSVTHVASLATQPLGWNGTLSLPRFDPSLGTLRSVTLTVTSTVSGSVGLENLNPQPLAFTWPQGSVLDAQAPSLVVQEVHALFQLPCSFTAYDGVTDYAGSSGVSQTFANVCGASCTQSASGSSSAVLAAYTGPSGNPGTFDVALQAHATAPPPLPFMSITYSSGSDATVSVTYEYLGSFARVCDVVWNGGGCPCGNDGAPGHGCGNSFDPSGAELDGSGGTSIASDSAILSAASMPNASALFFQADALAPSAAAFGDGVLCVQGTLVRLAAKPVAGGAVLYPASGDAPISVRGNVTAPGVRWYTTYYRNAAAFCTPATYNATNSLSIVWAP